MFGISFSELLLVGLVALLVLGPERLPGAARTAGLWIGRLKRSFNSIKTEVEREIGADEIRRQLHNEHILSMEQEARRILDPQAHAKAQADTQADAVPTPPAADTSANPVASPAPAVPDAIAHADATAHAAPSAPEPPQPPRAP